jgi:Ca2+-binding EF-hand superfamily protein
MAERLVEARVERQMSRVDTDGDGLISAGELAEGLEHRRAVRLFEAADADGDGAVSREEFEEFAEARRGRFQRRGWGWHGRRGG